MAGNQEQVLVELSGDGSCLLWCEGLECSAQTDFRNRSQLEERKKMAVISPPPGYSVLNNVLDVVKPMDVFLLNLFKQDDSLGVFLKNLGGILKHILNSENHNINAEELAGRLGYQFETIISGLKWWQAKEEITLQERSGQFRITKGRKTPSNDLQAITNRLQTELRETAAFRSYYGRADPVSLLRL